MAKHGVVHADFLMESNGEGLLLFTRIEPWLKEYREQISPVAYMNAEWIVNNSDIGRGTADRFRKRVAAYLEANKK